MISFDIADIVRIDDVGYPGLYEISGQCDAAKNTDVFDYDYYVTNDECESEMPVKASDLILVCRRELRRDINDGEVVV